MSYYIFKDIFNAAVIVHMQWNTWGKQLIPSIVHCEKPSLQLIRAGCEKTSWVPSSKHHGNSVWPVLLYFLTLIPFFKPPLIHHESSLSFCVCPSTPFSLHVLLSLLLGNEARQILEPKLWGWPGQLLKIAFSCDQLSWSVDQLISWSIHWNQFSARAFRQERKNTIKRINQKKHLAYEFRDYNQ